jgi:hypothetical protein
MIRFISLDREESPEPSIFTEPEGEDKAPLRTMDCDQTEEVEAEELAHSSLKAYSETAS